MSTSARSFGGGCAFAARAFGQSIGNRSAAFEREAAVERDPAGAFSRGAAAGAHSHASVWPVLVDFRSRCFSQRYDFRRPAAHLFS
ncbi:MULTISPECIES: hypothetical protein [Burkholderia]|uniref:hypothetical protein n=1 Tax=Burkholderia TaxID=32008 RepID=UPI00016AA71F|nr:MULTISPECIES: hypothetical protein [Burkholderia]ANW49216.1 hypothetical protein A7U58_03425 [Burkholderia pseudomallei]ANW55249.1 hypothetical protein A7U59_03440 [Burkholderia pseudomallei]AUG21030.1 hypothetical protein CXQ84_10590 [Burkholderia pseudomallei]EMP77349.1 hypothetical protein D512_10603 [Burkholderia pseudomallei MSHR1043]OMW22147.1 hypothetical protein AQ804_20295 [Burkholderia pseudomallei]